jgi:hypothetical protein
MSTSGNTVYIDTHQRITCYPAWRRVALRVVRGDKKGTECVGVQLGHPFLGGYKYGDLALQVGGVSRWDNKMWSWVLRDLGPRVIASCTSKLQTHPLVREGAPQHEDRKCPTLIQIWSWVTDEGLTPRQTGQLTVGCNITWTWLPVRSNQCLEV